MNSFERSTTTRMNSFTTSLPFLFEEHALNNDVDAVLSPPKTTGYVPAYRVRRSSTSYDFGGSADASMMPMVDSTGITSETQQFFDAPQNQGYNYQDTFDKFTGFSSPTTGMQRSSSFLRGSPAPSAASTEYSTSPFPFDTTPNPYSFDQSFPAAYRRDSATNEVFGTPMQHFQENTPFSPPPSQHYFSPVQELNAQETAPFSPPPSQHYFSPVQEMNAQENTPFSSPPPSQHYFSPVQEATFLSPQNGSCKSGTPDVGYSSEGHHSAFPQCRPVSSNDAAFFTGNSSPRSSLAQAANRSYLSTALRANEMVNAAAQHTPSRNAAVHSRYQRNSQDSADSNGSHHPRRSSVDSSASPLPQNLKGDPTRQAKVKTELCLFFSRGTACPFGSRCNYAHGEDELKYTKLFELEKAGLVADVDSYRAHPCFSWVATGAW